MIFERLPLINKENYTPKFIIDVGAHVGDFATNCKRIWPNADIHLFEANPNARDILDRLGYKYNIALLSDSVGDEYTYYMTDKWVLSTGNSIFKENTSEFDDSHLMTLTLKSDTLDNILGDVEFVDILKLDTQGSEIKILNGASNIIQKTKYIVIECSVFEYNLGGCKIGDVFQYMNENGFQLKDVLDINYLQDGVLLNQMDLLFENTKL
jgi:FkbM family methyltransferase